MRRMLQLILLITLFAGCSKKEKTLRSKPHVQTFRIQKQNTPIWLDTVGNVLANMNVTVTPQVSGQVESVYVKEGQNVKAGDLLYIIDPRPYEAQVVQAQGSLSQNKALLTYQKQRFERFSQLLKDDYISKINVEEIESGVMQAAGAVEKDEGALAQAKINLDWCYIRSPINGKISKYNIDVGNIVSPGNSSTLTTIRQLSPIQVQFTYTQREFEEIQYHFGTAKPFEFEVSLLEDTFTNPIKGQVYFYDNTINNNTGTILLKGLIPNVDERLWPGEFVRVRMLLKEQQDALLIPLEAVSRTQEGYFTFVVNNDIAELRKLELGRQVGSSYIVNKGVFPGEQVITIGQLNVRNGSPVVVDNQLDSEAEQKYEMQLKR